MPVFILLMALDKMPFPAPREIAPILFSSWLASILLDAFSAFSIFPSNSFVKTSSFVNIPRGSVEPFSTIETVLSIVVIAFVSRAVKLLE